MTTTYTPPVKQINELTDRELAEWSFIKQRNTERRLGFISGVLTFYLFVTILGIVIGFIALAMTAG